MPIVKPTGSRVLVTGANGFIAMWVVRALLERGYNVRAVVRSLDKGKDLKENFSSYGDRLELFVVEDITKARASHISCTLFYLSSSQEGAFDDAVKDVEAIEHMATPVILTAIEPDEYIQPAIKGTVGILESALKFGTKVKRIVVTSSVLAIYSPVEQPTVTFDESQWADAVVDYVKENGKDAGALEKYSASKALAEKAAWKFYNAHKHEVKWDLVVLNPPFVFGPPLYQVSRPEDLNASLFLFWNAITQDIPDEKLKETYSFVGVRDVATAHALVLSNEKVKDERIIVNGGSTTWQETRNTIHALQPDLYDSGILPRGNPNLEAPLLFKYSNEKREKFLGFDTFSLEKMIATLLDDFKARGWLEKPAASS